MCMCVRGEACENELKSVGRDLGNSGSVSSLTLFTERLI